MLSCKQVTRVCSDELERPLRLGERTALQLHLAVCPGCRLYRAQTRALQRALHAYAQGKAPTDPADGNGKSAAGR